MKTTRYLEDHPGSRPRIFAHRGLVIKNGQQVLDENTLGSFELALEMGADYLETDIQVTLDGVPVLFHDEDLSRLLGKKTPIAKLALSELSRIKLPFGGQIPTLLEALEKFPEAKFNLDFKTPRSETVGIEVIQELQASDRVLVSSFSEASRQRALSAARVPLASSAGSSLVLASYLLARSGQNQKLLKKLQGIDALQLPVSRFGIDFTHPSFLERVLQTGVEVHYWTINDPNKMRELFALGAHGIVTDRTDLAATAF